jgi:hypothetical protein
MEGNKKQRGGKRPGAGRPSSGIPYQNRTYRIPRAYLEEATNDIRNILNAYRARCKK